MPNQKSLRNEMSRLKKKKIIDQNNPKRKTEKSFLGKNLRRKCTDWSSEEEMELTNKKQCGSLYINQKSYLCIGMMLYVNSIFTVSLQSLECMRQ